jgi:hypothetical protein
MFGIAKCDTLLLASMGNAHASPEHTAANDEMVQEFSKRIEILLSKKGLTFEDGVSVEFDGYSETPLVLCEASACVSKPKGNQPDKVAMDALKLLFVRERLQRPDARLVMLFASDQACHAFRGKSWLSAALKSLKIELHVVKPESFEKVREATLRQSEPFRNKAE